MKRNRDTIAQMAIYDLLCKMQKNGRDWCVIEQITGKSQGERCEKNEFGLVVDCRSCIAAWLNERIE